MGCGASQAVDLEEQEITIEDQTREGQMGITDAEVMAAQARRKRRQKQPPRGAKTSWKGNGIEDPTRNGDTIHTLHEGGSESDSDTIIADSGTDSSDDDNVPEELQLRRRAREHNIERLDLPVDSDDQENTYRGEGGKKSNKVANRNAVDILNDRNLMKQNNKLDRIEKMDGANSSFMRRTNSLKNSCSFKSEDIKDLDADGDSSENENSVSPLPPNPWDARTWSSTSAKSGKSVASQSAVGLGFGKASGRKSKLSAEIAAHSASAAGAFSLWETTVDSRGTLERISDVTFLSDDILLVSQDAEDKVGIQTYDMLKKGQPGSVIGGAWIKATRGVCVNPLEGSTIAVTDPDTKSVKFFNSQGDELGQWKNDLFQMPGSIAVNSEGRYIVSDVMGKDKAISIFTPEGKVVKRFGIGFFDWPWYLTVDAHDRVIVSEQSSSTIFIFDKNGKFVRNFARQGKGDGKLSSPNGVSVDIMDNILVADTNNNRVSMFSPDGVFIKNILSHLSYKPLSMAFNDNGNLAVVSENSIHCYQTYQQKAFLL